MLQTGYLEFELCGMLPGRESLMSIALWEIMQGSSVFFRVRSRLKVQTVASIFTILGFNLSLLSLPILFECNSPRRPPGTLIHNWP